MRRRHRGDQACLWDMLKASRSARDIAGTHTKEQYDSDQLLRLAAERLVEILGEAARHVTLAFKREHPEIPWRRITEQRHLLAHEYDIIDPELMWVLISRRLDALIAALEPLVPAPPRDAEEPPLAPATRAGLARRGSCS